MWLDDQHGVYRTAQPRHPPVCSSGGTPGEHVMPGWNRLAGSVGAVSRLS